MVHARRWMGGALVIGAFALAAMGAPAPALEFATPYNDGGYNYTTGGDASSTVGNAGLYQRIPMTPRQVRSLSGPHGGYTSTTNKCRDCHSVHSAKAGGILLLRAASRDDACAFCHTGGGGSSTNIQMDNAYDGDGVVLSSLGRGTGHTLGFQGNAPADVRPAYTSAYGFSCFDCHSPHAASERMLATFADPGRPTGTSFASEIWNGSTLVTMTFDPAGIDLSAYNGGIGEFWGVTVTEGNIATVEDGDVTQLPVWPKGRFLLLKDPHSSAVEGADDLTLGSNPGSATQQGHNKLKIDWDDPLGPADASMDGDQDGENPADFFGATGLATVSEFCTDCHDGSAGAVTQRAVVWRPAAGNPLSGSYVSAWSHDSQPRDMCRQLLLDPAGETGNLDGTDDNFGPSCRQCHAGGSSCGQCHGTDDVGVPRAAYASDPFPVAGRTSYWPQASISRSAVASISGQCIDAGFSWPHRTLATNMLPDELYGIDFDGSVITPGEVRSDPETLVAGFLADQPDASEPVTDTWKPFRDDQGRVATAVAENLDSVCLTCHGDATYYNGGDASYFATTPNGSGWDLILKGLP